MRRRYPTLIALACSGLAACATNGQKGTLAELERVQADVDEVYLEDSLQRAAQGYRRFLEETSESARTPEAMRRLADLQIEQEYGVMGGGAPVEMVAPELAARPDPTVVGTQLREPIEASESEQAFERRATRREDLLSDTTPADANFPSVTADAAPAGPRESIQTYWKILETYPDYERNDQVLYQLSRAYDEIGEPDKAMSVMNQLVAEYPH